MSLQSRRRPWGRRPENRASVLGAKKQRVVDVVMDAWLTTAGLRGGQVLEASSRTFFVSHTPLPSASAGLQDPVHRDGLGSLVVSPCLRREWRHREVSSYPLLSAQGFLSRFDPGRDCDTGPSRRGATALTNASRRCGVPATGCCGTGQSGLLLHSALVSGRLCQVRAARHCPFPNGVLELLAGDPPCLGIKKQRVVKVVMDAWLATAGLRGGQVLEASTCTSPPATLSSPLPPLIPRVPNIVMDWAALS